MRTLKDLSTTMRISVTPFIFDPWHLFLEVDDNGIRLWIGMLVSNWIMSIVCGICKHCIMSYEELILNTVHTYSNPHPLMVSCSQGFNDLFLTSTGPISPKMLCFTMHLQSAHSHRAGYIWKQKFLQR